MTDLLDTHDGLGLAKLVADRDVTPAELLELAVARAERLDPQLNFLAHKLYDRARAQAATSLSGPFAGVPFLVKDLHMDIAGAHSGEGSAFWGGYKAKTNSTVFERFEAAGLVTFGKTTTPELGLTGTTESKAYGLTRNPWDRTRTSGGSSGGAAVAVAAGVVPIAQASDGGGSIRTPAACCGIFGLKPSRGRVPMGPHRTEGWMGLSTVHAVSRSVRDNAALLDAIHGPELGSRYSAPTPDGSFLSQVGRDPGSLRIAMILKPATGQPVDPEVIAATRAAAALCESLGHHVEEASLPVDGVALGQAMVTTLGVCTAADIDARAEVVGRPPREDELETMTRIFVDIGRSASGDALYAANACFQDAAISMEQFMQGYDIVLSPTLARPPIALGKIDLSPADISAWTTEIMLFGPFTSLHNQTGQPAISVPLGTSSAGLPIGIMFAGGYGGEALLYRLAGQLEAAAPWATRRPPVG